MRKTLQLVIVAFAFVIAPSLAAQELVLRAGTLLQCTLDEPDLSSKTAEPGEPVLCYLRSYREFGRVAYPRGSYLTGYLADYKDPGRLVGKGHIRLEFDRLILPHTEIPITAKVIAVRGFKVDREGNVIGKGHPKRDAIGWAIPLLWPVKLVTLPMRGPRPTLKGERCLTLRLLEDVPIPCNTPGVCRPISIPDLSRRLQRKED